MAARFVNVSELEIAVPQKTKDATKFEGKLQETQFTEN